MKLAYWLAAMAVLMTAGVRGDENAEDAMRYLKQAYPPAPAGMVRYVIILPRQDDDANYRVELFVGKKTMADSVNHFFFGGQIEEVNIEGWGFPRYVVKELGGMGSTKIGGGVPQEKFVQLQPKLIRHNSKLPIAVYVPEDAEVKYRIWSTTAETKAMPKG